MDDLRQEHFAGAGHSSEPRRQPVSDMPDTMADDLTLLFVYGTLKPGQYNFYRIEPWVRGCETACVRGVLVDVGVFPAMVEGDGIVRGVILTLGESALAVTDRIEGYEPARDRSLFTRELVEAQLEGGDVTRAWAYRFARPEQLVGRPKLLVGHRDGRPVFSWPPQDSDSLPNSAENESES